MRALNVTPHIAQNVSGRRSGVDAKGDATRPGRVAHDHLFGRLALGDPGRLGQGRRNSPVRFSISTWPMKLSLASLPRPLR